MKRLALLILCSISAAFAQTITGTINGTVTDPSGGCGNQREDHGAECCYERRQHGGGE